MMIELRYTNFKWQLSSLMLRNLKRRRVFCKRKHLKLSMYFYKIFETKTWFLYKATYRVHHSFFGYRFKFKADTEILEEKEILKEKRLESESLHKDQ